MKNNIAKLEQEIDGLDKLTDIFIRISQPAANPDTTATDNLAIGD